MDAKKIVTRNIEWKIHNFTKELAVDGKQVSTSNFEIPFDNQITKWYLKASIHESNFGVYLRMREFSDDFIVKCRLSFRTVNNTNKSRSFVRTYADYQNCKGYGWPTFISINEIFEGSEQYLHNGSIKLGFKIEILKNADMEQVIETPVSDSKYIAAFKDSFDNKSYSDVTFVCCDRTEIPAHRLVLAAISPVMKNMLDTGSGYMIKVDDIDGKTMTEILRYIYTEKVNDIESFPAKLLYGAEKYGLNGLKDLCAASMITNMSIENAVDYYYLADHYGIKDLLEQSSKFIKLNHQVLDRNEQNWEKLDKKQLVSLLGYYQKTPDCSLLFESSL
jgi:hypothetical protein